MCIVSAMNNIRLTGEAKRRRDNAVRRFAFEYPHFTHKEIGFKFGLDRSQVTRILQESKEPIEGNGV